MRRGSQGYTLIEMVVVIGIMVVLTALALPQYSGMQEKNALRNSAESVKQAIGEARAYALAPKDKTVVANNYNIISVYITKNMTKKDASGNYPLVVKAGNVPCGGGNVTDREVIRTLEFPDFIKVESFSPSEAPADNTTTAIRFPLANFSLTCGSNSKTANDNDFWPAGESTFRIKLKNLRLESIKDSLVNPEYLYVNVNKYSGLVWVSREGEDDSGTVILPGPKTNYDATYLTASDADPVQDTYLDKDEPCDGHGVGGGYDEIITEPEGTSWRKAGIIEFDLKVLGESIKNGKYPRQARLWLTTTENMTDNARGTKVYLMNSGIAYLPHLEKRARYGNATCPAEPDSPANLYRETDLLGITGEKAGGTYLVDKKKQYFLEFNIAKHIVKKADGSFDYSKPLRFVLVPQGDKVEYYSSEYGGSVEVTDYSGNKRYAMPGPYLEVSWW